MRPDTWVAASAELVGFASAAALTWQAYRLVRDMRQVRSLRKDAVRQRKQGATEAAAKAEQGADKIAAALTEWDAKDYRLVLFGGIGLPVSFALKLVALWLEP
jgi:hypothetical protein